MYAILHLPQGKPMELLKYDEEPALEELQRLVGGYIEVAPLKNTPKGLTLLVHEEGMLVENPQINHAASVISNGEVLVGDAALLLYEMS